MSNITLLEGETALRITDGPREDIYYADRRPDVKSPLVMRNKQEILKELSLSEVLDNIVLSAKLIYVAYCAVAGTQVQKKLSGLQKELLDLTGKSYTAASSFADQSERILGYVTSCFKYMLKAKEPVALKRLQHCAEAAADMAERSLELAKGFEAIANVAEEALEDTQTEQTLEYQKIQDIKKTLADLAEKQKKTEALQSRLVDDMKEMQALYEEAKEREEKESERAFILGITSAVTSAVGAGVGAFAAAYNPAASLAASQMNHGEGGGAPPSPSVDTERIQNAKQDAERAQQEAEQAEAEVATLEKSLEELADKAKTATEEATEAAAEAVRLEETAEKSGDASDADAASKAKSEAEAKAKAAEEESAAATKARKELEDAKEEAEKKRGIAKGMAATFSDLASGLDRMRESADSAASSVRKEKLQFLNQKLEMEKQNREALASLAEMAEAIKNRKVEENVAATAVETLQVAIQALKKVVTALANAALFWRSMEDFTKRLSTPELAKMITDLEDLDPQDRIDEYRSDPEFMMTAVVYLAKWVALKEVCDDYVSATLRTRELVETNIKSAPTIEEARKQAPLLATDLLATVKEHQALNLEATKTLEQQQEALVGA